MKDANHYQLDGKGNRLHAASSIPRADETGGNLLDSDTEDEDEDEDKKGGNMLDMISRSESQATVRTTLTRVMRSLNFERDSANLELGDKLGR